MKFKVDFNDIGDDGRIVALFADAAWFATDVSLAFGSEVELTDDQGHQCVGLVLGIEHRDDIPYLLDLRIDWATWRANSESFSYNYQPWTQVLTNVTGDGLTPIAS